MTKHIHLNGILDSPTHNFPPHCSPSQVKKTNAPPTTEKVRASVTPLLPQA